MHIYTYTLIFIHKCIPISRSHLEMRQEGGLKNRSKVDSRLHTQESLKWSPGHLLTHNWCSVHYISALHNLLKQNGPHMSLLVNWSTLGHLMPRKSSQPIQCYPESTFISLQQMRNLMKKIKWKIPNPSEPRKPKCSRLWHSTPNGVTQSNHA